MHGVVQGVGYRNFVKRLADNRGIVGNVRNVSDGSVEIVAVGEKAALDSFERDIRVSERYGPQVMSVERTEREQPSGIEYKDFRIERDKRL